MHWCMDETLAVLAMIPFIGYFFGKLHAWWHKHFHHKCHEPHCHDEHVTHPESHEAGTFMQEVDRVFDAGQITEDDYDLISQEDLEERMGKITEDLMTDLSFLKVTEQPPASAFRWFINGRFHLKATFKDRIFVHDDNCCEHGWDEVFK